MKEQGPFTWVRDAMPTKDLKAVFGRPTATASADRLDQCPAGTGNYRIDNNRSVGLEMRCFSPEPIVCGGKTDLVHKTAFAMSRCRGKRMVVATGLPTSREGREQRRSGGGSFVGRDDAR